MNQLLTSQKFNPLALMKYLPFLLLFFGFSLFAQEKPQSDDIKVGLVLSGGGAKGLAEIGVLKVIEASGVQIDYIGGASMGAIVGALYAAGYSAEEMDSIFSSTNFKTLIQDDLPRRAKSFYEKKGAERYALTLPFNNFKLHFPSGLSQGQNIYDLLSKLFYPVRDIKDFSQLPIPFFCIGTDIETGERLVFNQGSLPLKVLASAAIPSVFSPVEVKGRLVSDGGITDNFPVEKMLTHDVDYIIGVDVQDSLVGREKLQTVFQILTQVNNFRTIKAMKSKRKLVDLYINPEIGAFNILSFDRGKAIIAAGEKAALAVKPILDSIARLQQGTPPNRDIALPDSLIIEHIIIKGSNNYPRNFIRGKLRLETDHQTSFKDLKKGLDNLYATNNFNNIRYKLIPQQGGGNDLLIKLEESDVKTNLRFGAHYDELYKSSVLANFTHKGLIFKNDITSLDLIFGDNIRYRFDYFIDKGRYWSIGLKSSLNRFEHDIGFGFIEEEIPDGNFNVNKIQLEYLDFTNQFYVQSYLFRGLRFRTGVEHKYTRLKTETILLQNYNNNQNNTFTLLESGHIFGLYGILEFDSYNNVYFPTKGFFFKGNLHFYPFSSYSTFDFNKFAIVKGKLGYAFTLFPKFAVRLRAEMGFNIGNNNINALDFFLGGYGNYYVNNITSFMGYDYLSGAGNSYNKSAIELDYELFKSHHLMLGYNIANIGNDLYYHGKIFEDPKYTGFFLGYGIQSFFGPLEVFYSYSPERKKSEWYVSLGFWF